MNAILIILLTGFAVLGAYFLAQLLAGSGAQEDYAGPALVVLTRPLTVSEAVDIALELQAILPRCELLCTPLDADAALPFNGGGFECIHFVQKDEFAEEAARRLHLQNL